MRKSPTKITVFTGGTGGTKLVQGLQQLLAEGSTSRGSLGNLPGSETREAETGRGELTVIVNTGDDLSWWGLHVSPDVDSVLYGLAGLLSRERGWGVEDDSFRCLERMRAMGQPAWFSLGDLDLATHFTRTELLRSGKSLSEATAELAKQFGLHQSVRVLPMSDDRVSTMLETEKGVLSFQEYFVRERHQVAVSAVRFEGADSARPATGVIESIESADVIVFAPSNPVTSVGPILAVPGMREALRHARAPIVAVSPIIGGAAVSGPAAALMNMMGWPSSIAGIAQAYEDFLDVLVVDTADREEAARMNRAQNGQSGGKLHVFATNTLMKSAQDKLELARATVAAAQSYA